MFEQTIDQLRARIFDLFLGSERIARQQHARLELDQLGRHHQEITGHGEVQFLHQLQVTKILVRDAGDRDVVDIDLLLANQVEEKIERSFKVAQRDLKL